MSYDAAVLRRATARLEEGKRRRARDLQQRRAEVELRVPRVAEIDEKLRLTLLEVARATFRGGDPTAAIEALRDENLALQAEREQLLAAAGYPADVLEDKPACPKCEDKGWVEGSMCDCLKVLCAQEQIKELSKLLDLGERTFGHFRLDCYSTEPWPGMGTSPRENMTRVLDVCRNYATKFGKFYFDNLYLYGAPGLGKTFLSACIARTVADRGYSVVYETANHLFAKLEQAKFSPNEENRREAAKFLECDLLIIDDLGTEMPGQFVTAALYSLLNDRLLKNKPMVISTNLNVEDIKRRYSPQIASRLQGSFQGLTFVGEDIRLLKNRGY